MRAVPASLARATGRRDSALTIADGIAVKRPGELTLRADHALGRRDRRRRRGRGRRGDGVPARAGEAGRRGRGRRGRGRAAGGAVRLHGAGTTVVVLSGGNVDAGLLAEVARRHESQAGRRLVLLARLSDRPGSLARLLTLVGGRGANLLDVQHIREGIDLHVRETAVSSCSRRAATTTRSEVTEAVRGRGLPSPKCRGYDRGASIVARLLRRARRSRGCSRRPRGATARRARTGTPAPRSPRADRRAPRARDDQPLADLVDALMVVGLGHVDVLAGGPRGERARVEMDVVVGVVEAAGVAAGGPRGRRGRGGAGAACRPGRR